MTYHIGSRIIIRATGARGEVRGGGSVDIGACIAVLVDGCKTIRCLSESEIEPEPLPDCEIPRCPYCGQAFVPGSAVPTLDESEHGQMGTPISGEPDATKGSGS